MKVTVAEEEEEEEVFFRAKLSRRRTLGAILSCASSHRPRITNRTSIFRSYRPSVSLSLSHTHKHTHTPPLSHTRPFPSKENRQISERDDIGPPVVPGGQEIGLGSRNLRPSRRHVPREGTSRRSGYVTGTDNWMSEPPCVRTGMPYGALETSRTGLGIQSVRPLAFATSRNGLEQAGYSNSKLLDLHPPKHSLQWRS